MTEKKTTRKMKTISIKGRNYIPVSERVLAFNDAYPNGMIETTIEYLDELGLVRSTAKVTPDVDKPNRYFIAHSEENRASSMINKTSAVENCDTSSIGRCLGLMGIGIIDGIASADEINKAMNGEKVLDATSPRKTCTVCGKDFNPRPGTEAWAKTCFGCYKEKKAAPVKADVIPDPDEPPF